MSNSTIIEERTFCGHHSPRTIRTLLACCAFCAPLTGMADDELLVLEPLTVTATRIETTIDAIPAAVSFLDATTIQRGTQQLSLDEALRGVPGVFVQNTYNFAQDSRISIRGFGARANFGIRGIRLMIDAIPATTPDGQGSVDRIALGLVESIHVLRGPAGAFYGAASGGVILIETEEGRSVPFVETRFAGGDDGFLETQFKVGGIAGPLNYFFSGTDLNYDGFRDNGGTESLRLNGKFTYHIDQESALRLVVNLIDLPIQDDPGGLTLAEATANPRQARQRNLDFDSGETVEQETVGLIYQRKWGEVHSIEARSYFIRREFANRLPFEAGGQVSFERSFWGGGVQYNLQTRQSRLSVGVDYDRQDDDRLNFDNLLGVRGPTALDQNELVTSLGVFGIYDYAFSETFKVSGALRYDQIDFEVRDQLLSDGDDSGCLEFEEFSPMVGLSWAIHPRVNLFANVSTSFETPTTTELDNPGGGGFNPDLSAQKARSYELGVRGQLPVAGQSMQYEATVFHLDIDDALVPFELRAFPDREFFRNAGASERRGFEGALNYEWFPGLTTSAMYTWSDFSYQRFAADGDDFSGNTTPGIPEHFGSVQVQYAHESGFYLHWSTQWVGSFYANDRNSVEMDGYSVSDVRFGLDKVFGRWQVAPFVGITNLFEKAYSSNIRINAFGGRFYEPAPGRSFYGGIRIRLDFDGLGSDGGGR